MLQLAQFFHSFTYMGVCMCKGLGGASQESGWASSCILDWLLKGINSPPADAVNVVDVGSRQKLVLDWEESIYLIEFLSVLWEHMWDACVNIVVQQEGRT